jgi:hypothetical protein
MRKKFLLCLLILCLAPFVAISFYDFPAIDDFWSATKINEYGRIGSAIYFYEQVSGRYFSLFLMGILNGLPSGNLLIFQIWPILVFLLFPVAVFFLLKQVFRYQVSTIQMWIASLVWLLCSIASSRSLFNVWYWMFSSICYQLGIICSIFLLAAIVNWFQQQTKTAAIFVSILLLIIPGCVELLIPFITSVLALAIYTAKRKKIALTVPIVWLIISLVAAYFSIGSEGAQIRSAVDNASLSFSLLQSIKTVGYYGILWLFNPVNFSALLLLLLYLPAKRFYLSSLGLNFWIAIFALLALGLAVFFPIYWVGLKFPPPRITSIYFFLFSLVLISIVIGSGSNWFLFFKRLKRSAYYKHMQTGCWTIFIVSVFLSSNFRQVASELYSGKAASYHRESKQRLQFIRQHQGDSIALPPLKSWSTVLTGAESEIKSPDIFTHYKTFFNKKEIILRGN